MIKIFIIDDENLVQYALQVYLESESDIKIVGEASSAMEALDKIPHSKPDITLVDIEMPGIDGLTTIEMLKQRFPQIKTLVLSSHEEANYINRAIQAGAKGYLQKNTPPEDLINAIRYAYKGYFQLGAGLGEKLNFGENKNSSPEFTELEEKLESRLQQLEQSLRTLNHNQNNHHEVWQELQGIKSQLYNVKMTNQLLTTAKNDELSQELEVIRNQLHTVKVTNKKLQKQTFWLIILIMTLIVVIVGIRMIWLLING